MEKFLSHQMILPSPSDADVAAFRASGEFDEQWYCDEYPDVARSGIDPARHYLWLGEILGRSPRAQASGMIKAKAAGNLHRPVLYRIDRNARLEPDADWLILVVYTPDGALSQCQKYQIETFAQAGYSVALIVNTDSFFDFVDPDCPLARIIIVRQNVGFDFGAWKLAVEILGGLNHVRSVSFSNDSILPVCNGIDAVRSMRKQVAACKADVIFLTSNSEIKKHCQSYFFTFKSPSLGGLDLSVIHDTPIIHDKDQLIHDVEVQLSDRLSSKGLIVHTLFDLDVEDNPTIHYWEDLLERGFPFIKVQLVTAGIIPVDDLRMTRWLGPSGQADLRDHCATRSVGGNRHHPHLAAGPTPSMPISCRFNQYGAQQATNPASTLFPTIRVPLAGSVAPRKPLPKILAVIHGYYPDLLPTIFDQIQALGIGMRLLVTTDEPAKQATADSLMAERGLAGCAVVCPNRGRDVAPFLIEGAKHLEDAEVVLHLHTKKSPHDSVYAGWGDFLRANLIGSREIALSILEILTKSPVGLVYSDHFPPVNDLRNWGFDWEHANALLERIGCPIDADAPLEFPTSTMFWARREAIMPLFDLKLEYDDFEPEAGQIDGTLAHAVERSLLYVAEHAGFGHAKVTSLDSPTDPSAPLMRLRANSVAYALDRPLPRLNGGLPLRSDFYNSVPEIYPVGVARSKNRRRRLNALLPTMKPEKIYGGITTALTVIRQIANMMDGECDVRVLVTSDSVDRPSLEALRERFGRSFIQARPGDDVSGNTLVCVATAQNEPISVRANDMYIATAWWTADLGFRLIDQQHRMFDAQALMAYIIQDYEPGFYNWSNQYALADATYRRPDDTLAIFNSEELAGFMQQRYEFAEQSYIPYRLHPTLARLISPTKPNKLILAYGRPGVSRNCFELLVEGLRTWQSRNPRANSAFEVVFVGEEFDNSLLKGLENARCAGKLSIEEYAEMLNRACVGVSLMVSPHPSYPPLEMASAGCITITNRYEGKDLDGRSDYIRSLPALTPSAIADALQVAVSQVDFNGVKSTTLIRDVEIDMAPVDYGTIASLMLDRARIK